MNFEWDEAKAAANFRKHKVTFEEASTIFEDDLSLTGRDLDHSVGEHRFITFGVSAANRIFGSFACGARRLDSDYQREICDADGKENV